MEVNFYEMYLEEMALIPVLEAEEEEKVLALAATGDKEAKKRLVEGSLAKVAQMVKEYEGRELPMSDVVQEANVALTAAAAAYDGSQQWQEFLAQEIRQAVEAALEEQKTEAEIEENMTARVNVLQTVSQVMAKELGREATVAELAEKMKMTEDEVKDIMKLALDAITVNGEGAVSEEQQNEDELNETIHHTPWSDRLEYSQEDPGTAGYPLK